MSEPASDPDDATTAGPDAAGARGSGKTVIRSDAARASHQADWGEPGGGFAPFPCIQALFMGVRRPWGDACPGDPVLHRGAGGPRGLWWLAPLRRAGDHHNRV